MKKKTIVLLSLGLTLGLVACGKNVTESVANETNDVPTEVIAEEPDYVEDNSTTDDENVVTVDLDTTEELNDTLDTFASQFANYAGLALTYPEYAFTEFDDNAKCKIIAYSDAYTSDPGYKWDENLAMGTLDSARVQELAKRFFGNEVDAYAAQDINTNHDDVVESDNDGNLYFILGDWGTAYPVVADIIVHGDNAPYEVIVNLQMHDAETDTDSPLGKYTLEINVDNNGAFYITNFTLQ